MALVLTVAKCCGFYDLKKACILIARLHKFISVFSMFAVTILILIDKIVLVDDGKNISRDTISVVLFMLLLATLNITFGSEFVDGAMSDDPTKMHHFVFILIFNTITFLLRFEIIFLLIAFIEFYAVICTNSLYKQSKNLTLDTQLPLYNSCANNTDIPKAGPHTQLNHELNSNTLPKMNEPLELRMNSQINPEQNLQMDTQEDIQKDPRKDVQTNSQMNSEMK